MDVRIADKADFGALTELFQKTLGKQEFFQGDKKKTAKYLDNVDGTFYVVEDDEAMVGAMVIAAKTYGSHTLWKIRHAAILPEHRGKGAGIILIEYIDEKIRNQLTKGQCTSAKVEMMITDQANVFSDKNEKNDLGFWKRNGFKVEGTLADHFAKGETAYMLGKSF